MNIVYRMIDKVTEALSNGKKLSTATIAKRIGASRRAVMAVCAQNSQTFRRVDPVEVGWGATADKSKVFALI
jgi:hypothetical protein